MPQFPSIAAVLLVAAESRQRLLVPSLRVVGEPVTYSVEAIEPSALPSERARWTWDVILIDGESMLEDDERRDLLRAVYLRADRLSTVLYLFTRLPSEVETESAFIWADDTILSGWQFGDRLRCRVQAVALAPWRRSVALRMNAERRGDRCLRVLRPPTPESCVSELSEPRPPPSATLPLATADYARTLGSRMTALIADAFTDGRRVGLRTLTHAVDRIGQRLLNDRVRFFEAVTPEQAAEEEAVFRSLAPPPISPAVAARFIGAVTAIHALRAELRQVHAELTTLGDEVSSADPHEEQT